MEKVQPINWMGNNTVITLRIEKKNFFSILKTTCMFTVIKTDCRGSKKRNG